MIISQESLRSCVYDFISSIIARSNVNFSIYLGSVFL